MKKSSIILLLMVAVSIFLCGCQVDIQGPNATAKLFYKGENNNQEYLSRGSGMSGGSSYAAGGGTYVGTNNDTLFSFGKKNQE